MFSHRFQMLLSNLLGVSAASHSILLQLPGCFGEWSGGYRSVLGSFLCF